MIRTFQSILLFLGYSLGNLLQAAFWKQHLQQHTCCYLLQIITKDVVSRKELGGDPPARILETEKKMLSKVLSTSFQQRNPCTGITGELDNEYAEKRRKKAYFLYEYGRPKSGSKSDNLALERLATIRMHWAIATSPLIHYLQKR